VPFTPPKPLEPAPEDVQGATVLVVDDERVWRVILETDLRMLGYRVSLAEDGYEALARVEADAPEVAVVDLMLPDPMDGRSLLSALRDRSATLSVIFYTAQTELRPEARDPDVLAYLSKATDRADLYALLPTAIRKTRSRHPQ
jgi:DNA-binding response OmpR family regulator